MGKILVLYEVVLEARMYNFIELNWSFYNTILPNFESDWNCWNLELETWNLKLGSDINWIMTMWVSVLAVQRDRLKENGRSEKGILKGQAQKAGVTCFWGDLIHLYTLVGLARKQKN